MKSLTAAAAIAAVTILPAHAAGKYPSAPKCAECNRVNVKGAVAMAKRTILYNLKDPESARWRRAKVASNGNVCIEVNAKNSYGGYTGFTTYLFNSRNGSLVSGESDYAGMYCGMSRVMPNAVYVNAQ